MDPEPRPLRWDGILDGAFAWTRAGAGALLVLAFLASIAPAVAGGLALLPAAVVVLALHGGLPSGRADLGPADWFSLFLFGALALAVATWVYYAVWGAMVLAVDRIRGGAKPRVGDSLRAGARVAARLLGTLLLVGLVCAIPAVLAVAGFVAGSSFGLPFPIALVLLGLPAFAVTLWIGLRLSVVPQIVVFEQTAGLPALARSGELMRGQLLRVGGILLLLVVLFVALSIAVQSGAGSSPVLGGLLSLAVQLVMQAYGVALAVVLYFDLRVRKGERIAGDPLTTPAPTTP
jgi:hypothetical protein